MVGVSVTVENFTRAETDTYLSKFVKGGAFGNFSHFRKLTLSTEKQDVIRMNQDTVYSVAIFDLDASPVTVAMPDPKGRFQSLMPVNQDHETFPCLYGPGSFTFTRNQMRTRYVALLVRTFMIPANDADQEAANALQDTIQVKQEKVGSFQVPEWNLKTLDKIRKALLTLSSNSKTSVFNSFGELKDVDKLGHMMACAAGWGGNRTADATYVGVYPRQNDGKVPHVLTVKDVPIETGGFWSIIVYNKDGYMEPTESGVNSINNLTAKANADGSYTIHFGNADGETPVNCLPICEGWNYLVRLYRPLAPITSGKWKFPTAKPTSSASKL